MPIPKTSEAEKLTAHLNPIHPDEREVLNIVRELKGRGYNFKQIVVDAILRWDGKDPVTFQHEPGASILPQLEQMFASFAQEIVNQVKTGRIQADDIEEDGERASPFAQRFAKSFVQRQQRAMGDEE